MSYRGKQADIDNARAEKTAAGVRVSSIVKVLKFDDANMTVDVQPLNKEEIDGAYASAAPLMAVPVAMLCCGTYTIRPWYERGDVGMVVYNDGDAENALEAGDEVEPNTSRNHAPEDSFFIGGIAPEGKAPKGLPREAVVVSAGSVYLAVTKDGILIKGDVDMQGTFTLNGIVLNTHVHGGVQTGGGSTSGPR